MLDKQASIPDFLRDNSRPRDAIPHGGDLSAVRRLYPDAPAPWIDLSTGINPHAYPFGALPAACFERLPEPSSLAALEAAASSAFRLPVNAGVVAAAGAQALIQALPRVLTGRRVGVLGPTYAEHAAAWRRAGRDVLECAEPEALADCDIAVIVNPNNPTGRIIEAGALARLARRTQLVVDESFCDFSPATSIAPVARETGTIVLRSFGKAYGLAGVRLGFCAGPDALLDDLREKLGPWPVSGPAIEIGFRALGDQDWLAQTRAVVAQDARRLDAALADAGFEPVGGTLLFRLVRSDRAREIADRLAQAGVHVRRFAEQPDWLRFGLPPADAWERLEAALRVAAAEA